MAMRLTRLSPRQRQRATIGGSRRSLEIRTVTTAIAGRCPRNKSIGNNINTQQDPAHQTACVRPKRTAE